MNKGIIAIAVAGVLAAPLAAQAETTIFGKMHVSAGTSETTDSTATPTTTSDAMTVESHASRLGVKGSHDLGGGMTAKYHIEYEVNPDGDNKGSITVTEAAANVDCNGDGTISTTDKCSTDTDGTAGLKRRNQWVGLGAGWGEVRIGRHDTPLKIAQGKFDQFNDTSADIKGVGKISQGENRLDNVIAYIGKFGSLTVAAAAAASEGDGKTEAAGGTGTGDTLLDTTSIAAMYKAGPLFVSLAMDSYDTTETYDTDSLMRAVATYKMGAMQAGLLYETGGYGSKANDKDIMGLSFAMGMGKNKVKLQYMTSENASTTAFEQTQTTVGYDVGLSKQVTGYVMYTAYEETQATYTGEYTAARVGMIVKF